MRNMKRNKAKNMNIKPIEDWIKITTRNRTPIWTIIWIRGVIAKVIQIWWFKRVKHTIVSWLEMGIIMNRKWKFRTCYKNCRLRLIERDFIFVFVYINNHSSSKKKSSFSSLLSPKPYFSKLSVLKKSSASLWTYSFCFSWNTSSWKLFPYCC